MPLWPRRSPRPTFASAGDEGGGGDEGRAGGQGRAGTGGDGAGCPLDPTALLADLATLPGLRALPAGSHQAAIDALVDAGRLRWLDGALAVGDTPAPMWQLCTTFDSPPSRMLTAPDGTPIGESDAAEGEEVLLGGSRWVVRGGGLVG